MRFEGTLTTWNDERGFGRIESTQGGEPIFVHISAWPRDAARPRLQQQVSFEVEVGPKGKRAVRVQALVPRAVALAPDGRRASSRDPGGRARLRGHTEWGGATLFAIPAFLLLFVVVAALWHPPVWVAAAYVVLSPITFVAYAVDKSAAQRGAWRIPENNLHLLALAGGWPGALLAQQWLRHKSTKAAFREVFWITVAFNVLALPVLAWWLHGAG